MSADGSGETLVKACALSDLEDGEIFQVELEGDHKLAIYKVGDEIFATDDTCTHGQASLSEDGFVEEYVVTCSWHDGAFDIRTGEPASLPCMVALKTYKVEIKDEDVYVAL